jgi:hypothetical protein
MKISSNTVYDSDALLIKKVYLTCSNMIMFIKCSSNSQDISDVCKPEDDSIQSVCDTY